MSEKALQLNRNEVVLSLMLSVSLPFKDSPYTPGAPVQPLVPGVVHLCSLPIHLAKGVGAGTHRRVPISEIIRVA